MEKLVRYFLLVFVNFVLFSNVSCQNKLCGCQLNNGSTIDLASVANTSATHNPKFALSHVDNATVYLIFYDPCNSFEVKIASATPGKGDVSCDSVAACMYFANASETKEEAKLYALGLQDTAKCYDDNGHPAINYTVPNKSSRLTVHLECKESEHELVYRSGSPHEVVLTLSGRCACPDRCSTNKPSDKSHRFSTGSILLITFFTLILAYTVFGVLYNFCNGAKGAELCPHVSFWTELPQLIIDGFVYTCTCITNRGGGQTGYSDI